MPEGFRFTFVELKRVWLTIAIPFMIMKFNEKSVKKEINEKNSNHKSEYLWDERNVDANVALVC